MKDSGYVGGESSHRFDRSHNELKILSLNARSLLPKIESLQLLVKAEILMLSVWLKPGLVQRSLMLKSLSRVTNVSDVTETGMVGEL